MEDRLENIERSFSSLTERLADPDVINNPKLLRKSRSCSWSWNFARRIAPPLRTLELVGFAHRFAPRLERLSWIRSSLRPSLG